MWFFCASLWDPPHAHVLSKQTLALPVTPPVGTGHPYWLPKTGLVKVGQWSSGQLCPMLALFIWGSSEHTDLFTPAILLEDECSWLRHLFSSPPFPLPCTHNSLLVICRELSVSMCWLMTAGLSFQLQNMWFESVKLSVNISEGFLCLEVALS